MRLDLFAPGDSVLLLGEGNFSFAVNLLKHHLPIFMVATCFERELSIEDQAEHLIYLEENEVPVYLDVGATRIHEHRDIAAHKYSKVVFNFPHIGGKKKKNIQEHRDLLREMFRSARKVVRDDGQMLVSLCRGQGGTEADLKHKPYEESWQISEMGAQGDFILVDVEPYVAANFPEYKCHDSEFSLKGALVHVFQKCEQFFPDEIDDSAVAERLEAAPISIGGTTVAMPSFLQDFYERNPMNHVPKHPTAFFKEQLMRELRHIDITAPIKILTDDDIPLSVDTDKGVPIGNEYEEEDWRLRMAPLQVLNDALYAWEDFNENGLVLHNGIYFGDLVTRDFLNTPPVSNQFLILGPTAAALGYRFIHSLALYFEKVNLATYLRPKDTKGEKMPLPRDTIEKTQPESDIFKLNFALEFAYVYLDESGPDCPVSHVYSLNYKDTSLDAVVIFPEKLTEFFFGKYTWRQVWSDHVTVKRYKNAPPDAILRKPHINQPIFQMECTIHLGEKPYEKEPVYRTLWLAAGQIIEKVEKISESGNVQLLITYHAEEVPLYLSRVKDIHTKIVCKMLTKVLGVYVG